MLITKQKIRRSLATVVVIGLLLVIVLDLIIAPVKKVEVESLTLDATQQLPNASIGLSLKYSRFSSVEPKAIRCSVESGDVLVKVTKQGRHTYAIDATCREEDVGSHASLIWNVLTRQQSSVDFECEVDVGVRLGHVIPYKHTVKLSSNTLSIQEKGPKDKDLTTLGQDDNDSKDESDFMFPSVEVQRMSMQELELGIHVELPKSSHQLAPKLTRVKLPPLIIRAQPNAEQQVGGILWVDAFDGVFSSTIPAGPSELIEDSHYVLLFGFDCDTTDCPWFRPMMDLFLTSAVYGTTKIDVTVDGSGSFMETLLGRQHHLYVNTEQKRLHDSRRLFSKTRAEAEANCVRLDDDSGDFDFSLCWLLEPAEGFTLVGDMSFFDLDMSGFGEMAWQDNSTALELDMKALFEMGDDREMMDMIGDVLLESKDDNILVDMTMVNTGSWTPFRVDMFCDGTAVDDLLTMTLRRATLSVDGDNILTDATGGLSWDSNQETFRATIQDPDFRAFLKGDMLDGDVLAASSLIIREGVQRWNSSLEGQISDMDNNVTVLRVDMNETTNDYAISGGATLDRNTRSLVGFIDDSTFRLHLNGAVDEVEETFEGGFGLILEGDNVFNSEWEGRLLSNDDTDNVMS